MTTCEQNNHYFGDPILVDGMWVRFCADCPVVEKVPQQDKGFTTIRVSDAVRSDLNDLAETGESASMVVARLIKEHEGGE